MKEVREQKMLTNISANDFARRAAYFVNEINAVHPFIDGNGRTQRIWLRNLGVQAAHNVVLKRGDKDRWYKASEEGFYRSDDAMASFIADRIHAPRGQVSDKAIARRQRAAAEKKRDSAIKSNSQGKGGHSR